MLVDRDSKISSAQFLALGIMIGNSLFVGMGNIILIQTVKENTWLNAIIGVIVGTLPMLILVKIMNYQPSLNIIDKIKTLFNPIISQIVNFLLFVIVTFTLIITLWAATEFASTKYLSETPFIFVMFLFMIPIVYAVIMGIETISRTNQLLFIISILIHIIITSALFQFVNIKNIYPILVDGFTPLVGGVLKFITYCGTPFVALLIIPKNRVTNPRRATKYLLLGYVIAGLIMLVVFFMNMSSVGVNIASMYRYPEYYIVKKISVANAFDNVENFLSIHWIFNLFSIHMLGLYYSKEYIINVFGIKKNKTKTIITLIVAFTVMLIASNMFPISTEATEFMSNQFPFVIGIPLLIIITILMFKIMWRSIKTRKIKNNEAVAN